MDVTFPRESAEYRAARNELLSKEIELRRQMEAVAEARRELPPGGEVPEDYVFQGEGADGEPIDVRLSELFAPGKDSLAIYKAHVSAGPRGRSARPGPRDADRDAPAGGDPLPFVRGPARSTRRDGRARRPARELRRGGQVAARSAVDLEARARLAPGCASSPRRTTPTTRTTSPRRPRAHSGRC